MNLTRWSDERLDDLHGLVKANDHRLDTVQDMTQTNDRRLTDIEKDMNRTETVHISKQMLLATWASPIITMIVALLALLLK